MIFNNFKVEDILEGISSKFFSNKKFEKFGVICFFSFSFGQNDFMGALKLLNKFTNSIGEKNFKITSFSNDNVLENLNYKIPKKWMEFI